MHFLVFVGSSPRCSACRGRKPGDRYLGFAPFAERKGLTIPELAEGGAEWADNLKAAKSASQANPMANLAEGLTAAMKATRVPKPAPEQPGAKRAAQPQCASGCPCCKHR